MRTAAMMGAVIMTAFVGDGVGAAPPPPAMAGHDARLKIPVCAYGEMMYWRTAQGGWVCDGRELTRIRQKYTATVAGLLSALDAMPVPPVPPCSGTDLPTVCIAPITTPYCTAHPTDPACVSTPPPTSDEGCGCIAEWSAFSQWRTGGGESADTVEVPVAAGSATIPDGRTLYYRVEGAGSSDGTDYHGWSAFACNSGRFVRYADYPMSIEWAWSLKSDALPMSYSITSGTWEQPFTVRSACPPR